MIFKENLLFSLLVFLQIHLFIAQDHLANDPNASAGRSHASRFLTENNSGTASRNKRVLMRVDADPERKLALMSFNSSNNNELTGVVYNNSRKDVFPTGMSLDSSKKQ
jgi:hypothetical protein